MTRAIAGDQKHLDGLERLRAWVAAEERHRTRTRHLALTAAAGWFGALLICSLADVSTAAWLATIGACAVTSIAGFVMHVVTSPRIDLKAALDRLQDPAAVGSLIEAAFEAPNWKAGLAVVETLCRMLHRLTPDDAKYLTERQRDLLVTALDLSMRMAPPGGDGRGIPPADIQMGAHPWLGNRLSLVYGIVCAMESVQDTAALPLIEEIAAWPAGLSEERGLARDTARGLLRELRAKAEHERQAATLLRPAERISTEQDVLLRPARGPIGTDSRLLLRASTAAAPPDTSVLSGSEDTKSEIDDGTR